MKLLLINQAFVSPHEPGHTRHFELAQFLSSKGDELTIIASDINYQTGKRVIEHKGIFAQQEIEGIRILRAYVLPVHHRSFAWRILAFFSFMLTSLLTSFRVGHIDAVIATSPPIFQAFSAWLVSFVRRKPLIFEVRDLWPEFAIDMGVLKNKTLIRLSRRLERFLYARARFIWVNSPAYVEYLKSVGVPEAKIQFIAYGADTQMFNPEVDGSAIRHELGFEGKFVVMYAGAIGLANDIDTLLRAANRLRDYPDIQFVLFGDGKERARLEKEIEREGSKNVLFAGSRPKEQMPQVIASSDVCLAILQDIKMFRTTYPNKVFDYMAGGRPTILVIDGVIREVIETAAAGVFVPPGDDEALAAAILRLYQNQATTANFGANARTYVVEHFERHRQLQITHNFLQQVVEMS